MTTLDALKIENAKNKLQDLATQQQTAASDPKFSVWVEASAGTGKTKVLSDRVLRLLLSGVLPSKILCLTYTKAAAVEMKSRIYDKLSKWASLDDQKLTTELLKLDSTLSLSPETIAHARTLFALTLDSPVPVKIQTIHSFCEEILKRFPLEAGIAPYFEVMDETAASEALANITHHILSEIENNPTPEMQKAVLFLTRNISEFNFQELLTSLALNRNNLKRIFSAFPDRSSFFKALQDKLGLQKDFSQEDYIKHFISGLNRPLLKKCAEALCLGSKTDKQNGDLLFQNLEIFSLSTYQKIFLTQEGNIKKTLANKESLRHFEDILQVMTIEAERLLNLLDTLKSLKIFEATQAMTILAERLIDEYNAYKQKNARFDYEDLIELTQNLLEKSSAASWVLYKLDGGLEHVLIDEAQDTSPSQWAIVKALTDEFFSFESKNNPRSVFAVGDRKQSIYGFQGAKPEKFDEMSLFYKQKIENFKKIRLDVSFRSTEAVLKTVNDLFALDDAKQGVVLQNEKVEHLPFRLGEGGHVELWPIEENEKDESDDVWYPPVERQTKTTAIQRLASKIALKIKDMVQRGEILTSKGRPFQYSDFMVLVQRRNAFMEEFVRACKINNVEVSGVDKMKLGQQLVIEDLISLAKFLLLPGDDLSLAEVLKSPLYNLTDDDLFNLCYQRGESSLWQRLNADPKYTLIAQNLSELLTAADQKRPFELFSKILIDFDGRKKFWSRLGLEAKDAIDEFMNLALSFEANHIPNLQNFIAWIESSDIEVKRELEQNDLNAVRIMTVHGSKGLQAPVVILADTLREVKSNCEAGLVFDDSLVYFPLSADYFDKTCKQIHDQDVSKAYDEYRRLLYVALTRAEDRLYIAGYGKPKKEDKSWYGLLEKTIKKEGLTFDGQTFVIETPQIVPYSKPQIHQNPKILEKDTSFAYQKAPVESALSKPYTPSHMEDDDDLPVSSPLCDNGHFYKRGTVIHKILELLLTSSDKGVQKEMVKNYLDAQKDLSENLKTDIKKEIFAILENPDFDFLFAQNARAEVPVMGEVDGKIISGQIDRLVVQNDKVVIIDFKTNRPAAAKIDDVPSAYINQLKTYQKLLCRIYKDKEIEAYILWTNTLKLMKI